MSNKYKVGDKVKITENNPYSTGLLKNDVVIIKEVDVLGIEGILYVDKNGTNWIIYKDVCEPISATQENFVVLQPGEVWDNHRPVYNVPDKDDKPETPKKSCTCGISAIGGGIHSDWCDLSNNENNN